MKSKKLRIVLPLIVCGIVAVGFVLDTGIGTLSAVGWKDISLLCPLGALATMLASKTILPRAVVSIVVAVLLILVFGRLFCGWICPVPVINKIPQLFRRKSGVEPASSGKAAGQRAVREDLGADGASAGDGLAESGAGAGVALTIPKCGSGSGASCACSTCSAKHGRPLDSRHFVLGGALLSAAVFGFPVFCLVCPIGLTFALIFLVIALFSGGDVTWSLVVVPALLALEVVFFKKWCSAICPLGSLMSLVGKLHSKTLRPTVNESVCIETAGGVCGRCAEACEVGINPRHPSLGTSFNECLKCRACVEACPTEAIAMPLLPRKAKSDDGVAQGNAG
ncbi:4Fe-4S binding protein [Xiamenia xianingshaonis]|uniref:4Fe-4S binding protein n=1 Tax=Xiamenia xianingshaonis TaxID=2682776 RepID=A0ABX0IFI4_9ACTN|nr:4Fe-4S binding protein [Xiamenia xianingshaonis]NHM13569.1 4Fe-4S binding protein [Xiamenia xianingshaonis]